MDSRQVTHTTSPKAQGGFTFIEVLLALLVLVSASAILVGMQSSAISRTIRDRNAQQAMLFARRVMSSIEVAGKDAPQQNIENQPALSIMETYGIPQPTTDLERKAIEPLRVTLLVEDFVLPLPNVAQDPMKKWTMRLQWGDTVDDFFVISYLMAVS